MGASIRRHGRRFWGYRCDLGSRSSVGQTLNTLLAKHPTISVLVNNAGIVGRATAEEHGDDLWDQVLEVNLSACFRISRRIGASILKPASPTPQTSD